MSYKDKRTQKIIEEALLFIDEDEVANLLEENPDEWESLSACKAIKALAEVLDIDDSNYIDHLREWGFSDSEIEYDFELDVEEYDAKIAYEEHVDLLINLAKEDRIEAY